MADDSEQRPPTTRSHLRRRRPLADELRDVIIRDFVRRPDDDAAERRLPSENELAREYGVSRVTVRAAIRSLREAGLVSTRQGAGARILRPPAVLHGLDRLGSLENFAREASLAITTADLSFEEIAADEEIASKLEAENGHTVMVVRRVRLLDGVRAAYLVDCIPSGVLPFELLRSTVTGSVLDVLMAHDELAVEYADTEFRPVGLPADIASRLDVPDALVVMFMDSVTCGFDGRRCAWARAWLLPEYFRFVVRRRPLLGTERG